MAIQCYHQQETCLSLLILCHLGWLTFTHTSRVSSTVIPSQCTGPLSQVLSLKGNGPALQLSHPWVWLTHASVITASYTVLLRQCAGPNLHPFPATRKATSQSHIREMASQLSFTHALKSGSPTPQSLPSPPTFPSLGPALLHCLGLVQGPLYQVQVLQPARVMASFSTHMNLWAGFQCLCHPSADEWLMSALTHSHPWGRLSPPPVPRPAPLCCLGQS